MSTVLLVDDSSVMRRHLKRIIHGIGHEVISEACNGIEGFEKYKADKPDIVMLDITMDKMNGLECLKAIRDYDNKAVVIMCSSAGQDSMITEAVKKGAVDFIVKPFEESRVIRAFGRLED